MQGLILGSYFYGYIATQLFSGWLVRKIGGKYPFGIGILLCSIFTLVTPSCAYVHYGLIIALRVAEGLVTVCVHCESLKTRMISNSGEP